jgi:hypothetical protein
VPCHHELVPFKAAHVAEIAWLERGHALLIGQQAISIYEQHPGWSGFCNGRFIAAGGIVVPYRGLGEGWVIAGPGVKGHYAFFHRTVKRAMIGTARALKVRRLQVLVRDSFTVSHGWVTDHLGFEKEGVMRRYGVMGEDMVVYVRFFDDL